MSEEIQFDEMVERVKTALAGQADAGSQMFPTETADEIIQIVYERTSCVLCLRLCQCQPEPSKFQN